jgi:Na+/melibiose symporter-like transporter
LADGIMTPIVGFFSDKFNTRWGKRKPWFFIGTLIVIPTFLGIFAYPPFINNGKVDNWVKNTWYLVLPALFNVGWASVQIAHMSIVN